jgi:ABC-type lipoprotein release transport system permease subunit
MQILIETVENIRKNPIKSLATFLSVGVGVGILIFALSISQLFNELLDEKLSADGRVLVVSNSELQSDGSYDRVRPGQLDLNASEIVAISVEGIDYAEIITPSIWNEISADGKKYNLRNVVGSGPSYFSIMGLNLISGEMMTETMLEKSEKVLWLTEQAAIALFGSADQAIGQQIQSPEVNAGRGNRESRTTPPVFTVAGVYDDVDELKRKAYGIADVLVPYNSMLPSTVNERFVNTFLANAFVVKVQNNDNAEAQIRSVLASEYGDDLIINVWEGTTQSPSDLLEDTRQSVQLITTIINILGFILLVSGTIGILSIMLVEIISKNRDIALERALGASVVQIIKKYLMQSLMLSGISALIGIGLAYFFSAPLAETITTIFSGISPTEIEGSIVSVSAILVGVTSAMVFGGVFGVLPLSSIVRRPISEGIRDA